MESQPQPLAALCLLGVLGEYPGGAARVPGLGVQGGDASAPLGLTRRPVRTSLENHAGQGPQDPCLSTPPQGPTLLSPAKRGTLQAGPMLIGSQHGNQASAPTLHHVGFPLSLPALHSPGSDASGTSPPACPPVRAVMMLAEWLRQFPLGQSRGPARPTGQAGSSAWVPSRCERSF